MAGTAVSQPEGPSCKSWSIPVTYCLMEVLICTMCVVPVFGGNWHIVPFLLCLFIASMFFVMNV